MLHKTKRDVYIVTVPNVLGVSQTRVAAALKREIEQVRLAVGPGSDIVAPFVGNQSSVRVVPRAKKRISKK